MFRIGIEYLLKKRKDVIENKDREAEAKGFSLGDVSGLGPPAPANNFTKSGGIPVFFFK